MVEDWVKWVCYILVLFVNFCDFSNKFLVWFFFVYFLLVVLYFFLVVGLDLVWLGDINILLLLFFFEKFYLLKCFIEEMKDWLWVYGSVFFLMVLFKIKKSWV